MLEHNRNGAYSYVLHIQRPQFAEDNAAREPNFGTVGGRIIAR